MGRRGPQPDHAKGEAFARLIAEGVPSARASRVVGIHPRTGKSWRNGRRIVSGGRLLDLPPVMNPIAERHYTPRYLSEDERVRPADLRREGRTMRAVAILMGRSASTVSRELRRGADTAIEAQLNERPRWETPAERLARLLGPPPVLRR